MLKLEKVTGQNVWDLLELQVAENQKDFVASNDESLIEAYVTLAENGKVFPFGIYDDDKPVGFLMIGFGGGWEGAPPVAERNYNFWRFMIDERYQRKGYGKQAVQLALNFIKTLPCGPAEYCFLSYEPENEVARRLYRTFGFVENGEMDGDEIVAVLKL